MDDMEIMIFLFRIYRIDEMEMIWTIMYDWYDILLHTDMEIMYDWYDIYIWLIYYIIHYILAFFDVQRHISQHVMGKAFGTDGEHLLPPLRGDGVIPASYDSDFWRVFFFLLRLLLST